MKTNITKNRFVTGGSRGLGKDIALNLAARGNDVIIIYSSKKYEALSIIAEGVQIKLSLYK